MRGVHEMSVGGAVDPAQVGAAAQEVVALGRAAGDTRWIVRGLRAQALCTMVLALWADAAALSDEVIRIGSPADARSARSLHLVAMTLGDGTLGDVRDLIRQEVTIEGSTPTVQLLILLWDALVAAADGSPDAEELIVATEARHQELYAAGAIGEPNLPLLADAYAMHRDLDGAIAYLQRVNDAFRRAGDLGHASTYILVQAFDLLERGDPLESVTPLVEEAATYTSPYDRLSVAYLAACRALLAVRSGHHERATELAAEALRVADATHEVWHQADLRRWLSAVPRATGDDGLERRMLEEAALRYGRKQIRSYDAEIRRRLGQLGTDDP
jgi:hypothetical protein